VGVEVADEPSVLPGLHAKDVLLALVGRRQRERRDRLRGGRAHDLAVRPRLPASPGNQPIAVFGAREDGIPREVHGRARAPGIARGHEGGLGDTAREHALEGAGIVAGERQVNDLGQVHRHPLGARGRHLEEVLRLVVARVAAGIGGILVHADVHPVLAGLQRLQREGSRYGRALHATACPPVAGVVVAGEVRRRLGVGGLAVEAQLEGDGCLRAGGRGEQQRGQRERRDHPGVDGATAARRGAGTPRRTRNHSPRPARPHAS
jgi:hypothetical protein